MVQEKVRTKILLWMQKWWRPVQANLGARRSAVVAGAVSPFKNGGIPPRKDKILTGLRTDRLEGASTRFVMFKYVTFLVNGQTRITRTKIVKRWWKFLLQSSGTEHCQGVGGIKEYSCIIQVPGTVVCSTACYQNISVGTDYIFQYRST